MERPLFKLKDWLEITQYLHQRLSLRAEFENFDFSGFPVSMFYRHSTMELISMVKSTNERIVTLRIEKFNKQLKEIQQEAK